MPINILNYTGKVEGEAAVSLERLCEGEWALPDQIEALEYWLQTVGKELPAGSYVADIGFGMRVGALGGGGVLKAESMGIMSCIGMDLFLSEYADSEVADSAET